MKSYIATLVTALTLNASLLAQLPSSAGAAIPKPGKGISKPAWCAQPILSAGAEPSDADKTAFQQVVSPTLAATDVAAAVQSAESYIRANPTSAWTPSLRVNLGKYYRDTGQFTPALQHWEAAWEATKQIPTGNGKQVADYALAHWTRLLASLGRGETLGVLMQETAGRRWNGGPWQQMFLRTQEAYNYMLRHGGDSYKCGLLALHAVAQELRGHQYAFPLLYKDTPATSAYSLKALAALAGQLRLDLTAVYRPNGDDLVVPSVVHWRQNHYAAIVAKDKGLYRVVDPTFGDLAYLTAQAINSEASGYFLIPASQKPPSWRSVADVEAANVLGHGVAYVFNDGTDQVCKSSCPPGVESLDPCKPGMPIWNVHEPYINLWLSDEPLGYQPALGQFLSFNLTYKQRDEEAMADATVFGFGQGWNSEWLSYAFKVDGPAYDPGRVKIRLPGGGISIFDFRQGNDAFNYYNNCRLHYEYDAQYTNRVSHYELTYPNGMRYVYEWFAADAVSNAFYFYLTKQIDPQGFVTTFNYQDYDPQNPAVRLTSITDAGGRNITLSYNANLEAYPQLVSQITDPYTNSVFLNYNDNGQLTSIVDVAGLRSSLSYDANGWPATLVTPYGTNTFEYADRSCLITEPNGDRQVYLFMGDCNQLNDDPWMPLVYPSSDLPIAPGLLNTWDNTPWKLNSFHWDRKQAEGLPTAISQFTTNHYLGARMRHWLGFHDYSNVMPVSTLAFEREASVDGINEGQKTWYDYANKPIDPNTSEPIPDLIGTQIQPSVIARLLPDNTVWYESYARNEYGLATQVTSTYGLAPNIQTRTQRWVYDSTNKLDLIEEHGPDSDVLLARYTYNTQHQLLTLRQYLNASGDYYDLTNVYDGLFRLRTNVNSSGLVTIFNYNNNATTNDASQYRLTNIVQQTAAGQPLRTNSFTWLNGRRRTRTDPYGLTLTYSWDNLGRLTQIDYPGDPATSAQFLYSLAPGQGFNAAATNLAILELTAVKDRLGHWTYFGFDRLGRKTSETDANNHTTAFSYCGCGSPQTITNALQRVTQFIYDLNGRLTDAYDPDTNAVHFEYNRLGQLTKETIGSSWRAHAYNNQGLLVSVTSAAGRELTVDYNLNDDPVTVTDAQGVSVSQTFDYVHRRLSRAYPDEGVEHWVYTNYWAGPIQYVDPLLTNTIAYAYDARGLMTQEVHGSTTQSLFTNSLAYTPAGELAALTDGRGKTTQWHYDLYGRVDKKTNALGSEVLRFQYDANDRLTNRWSAAKGNTAYAYDAVGNLLSITYPVTPPISMAYDALNQLTNRVDALGTTRYTYYTNGLLASEDGPWANDTVSYSYTHLLLTGLTLQQPGGAPWSQSYAYDYIRRLTNITSPAGGFGYAYYTGLNGAAPASELIDHLSLPNGATLWSTYDNVARKLGVYLNNSQSQSLNYHAYTYNQASQRERQTRSNQGVLGTVDYTYDAAGQLKTASARTATGQLELNQQMAYDYDAAGNLHTRYNQELTQNFSVDDANRLSQLTRSDTLTVVGTYQGANVTVTVNGQPAVLHPDHTFAAPGMTATNGVNTYTAIATNPAGKTDTNTVIVNLPAALSFQYDANGNLTSDGQRAFYYDDENQLTNVTVANAWKVEFAYDGLGRRRITRDYSWNGAWNLTNEVRYVYDGNRVLQERDGNNVPVATYTRGLDLSGSLAGAGGIGGLLARSLGYSAGNWTTNFYYHADGNGNVTCLLSTNQTLVGIYQYDPYGFLLSSEGPQAETNYYRFSSKEFHPNSGLYYFGFRYYDPNLQRWLNQDPIGEEGGINLYGFVRNAPTDWVDPFGEGLFSSSVSQSEWDEIGRRNGAPLRQPDLDDFLDRALECGRKGAFVTDSEAAQGAHLAKEIGIEAAAGMALPELKSVRILSTAKRLRQVKALTGIPKKLPVLEISASKYPQLAENILHAQRAGHPEILTHGGDAIANRAAALEGVPTIKGMGRDEYPFVSSLEGGAGSWVGHVPEKQHGAQGGLITQFLREKKINPGDQYRVVVVP